jgi:methionyl-tRNA synthetase
MEEIKEVVWRWDWGVYMPFCPYCDEVANGEDKCDFCGKTYKWVKGKHEPKVVEVGEYTVVQSTNKHIMIVKDGKMVMHINCRKKMTEDELKEQVNFYEKMCEKVDLMEDDEG